MSEPIDINQFINDASIVVVVGDYEVNKNIYYGDIPEIHDEVSLGTNEGYSMMVEVTEYSEDGKSFVGKVTHGYYPKNKENTIEVGDIVCFSKDKIGGIHKR